MLLRSTWSWAVLLASLILCISAQAQLTQDDSSTPSSIGGDIFSKLKRIAVSGFKGEVLRPDPAILAKADAEAGVVRLTDDNIDGYLRAGGADTLWVILVHEDRPNPVSQKFLEAHTNASVLHRERAAKQSDAQLEAGGVRDVRYARLEYTTEWKTCTRWLLFRPPALVLATNSSATLRFLTPHTIRSDGERWTNFFVSDQWESLPKWESAYAPRGERAWLIESYISLFEFTTPLTAKVPSFVYVLVTGAFARWIMSFLHSGPAPRTAGRAGGASGATLGSTVAAGRGNGPQRPAGAAAGGNAVPVAASPGTRRGNGAKRRK